MTSVHLKPLNSFNREICAKLQVAPHQVDALPSNRHSIAQLQCYPKTEAVALVNDEEEVVGDARLELATSTLSV